MNKDFEKRLNDAYERFAKDKADVEALKKELAEKEKSLEEFREDILLNMMHEDKHGTEQVEAEPKLAFTYMDKVPSPTDLTKTKAIVVHYNPSVDGVDGDEDSVFVSYEDVEDLSSIPMALAYALVKSMIYYGKSDRDSKEAEFIENVMDKIDITEVANKALTTVSDAILGKSIIEVLNGALRDFLGKEDDDE